MDISALVDVGDGDITVEANSMAEALGLSVDQLRAAMRQGIVYGVVEHGLGEDAGKVRLTVQHRARVWTMVAQRRKSSD